MSWRALVCFAAVALGCFGCDQLSKELARSHLAGGPAISLLRASSTLEHAEATAKGGSGP